MRSAAAAAADGYRYPRYSDSTYGICGHAALSAALNSRRRRCRQGRRRPWRYFPKRATRVTLVRRRASRHCSRAAAKPPAAGYGLQRLRRSWCTGSIGLALDTFQVSICSPPLAALPSRTRLSSCIAACDVAVTRLIAAEARLCRRRFPMLDVVGAQQAGLRARSGSIVLSVPHLEHIKPDGVQHVRPELHQPG